ncbi:MAG: bifunctional shikimate kinase/3-dehydroquinate synthase [Desulfarculaceae bacterium]|nr:bifunctional shikimate kinase/3-dehydroquinate synthase [Desulfarculaceae bacterium]MCF8071656.1 bifunctional shikimate kinase/3-dehydroquinate synthase [Desulfarculaceae bacterium]MCF8102497.1 bifunctional shikimate kinase/3-dehydroquinate synthase [Desulfarculaceae bacterium]MCF8114935.1 bifunctional shikimate kinase/3-dehydroquinate synthase [Desulfarculaceae bacterium]
MSTNIYLTGFMGAGKSTVGRLLAMALGRRLVDLDDPVSRRLGMPIRRAFATLGEDTFRAAESAELKKLASRGGLVVATGGGVPVDPANRALMRGSGTVVHLAATLPGCTGRLGPVEVAERPLWQDPGALERLFASRQEAYADCDFSVAVQGRSPEEVMREVAAELLGSEEFVLDMEGRSCRVASTWDAPAILAQEIRGRRVALVTDRKVGGLHSARYREVLDDPVIIELAPGERSKSLRTAERVYNAMLEARLERGDLLVALGGGVVTDLGAFVGATYKRGLGLALASTTLLGCVDAAIGGKAAVNLGAAKNQVGCFTQPQAVLLDLQALSTLPRKQRVEGLAEAYKTGLVAAPELAELCAQDMATLLGGDVPGLAEVVRRAARAKAGVVTEDFREGGRRAILNLGHTYGHAIEGWHRFRLGHGQAVAAGMMVAAAISAQRGLLASDEAGRVIETSRALLPKKLAWAPAGEAWEIMLNDKKNQGGKVRFVLLEGVGRAVVVADVTTRELAEAIEQVRG